MQWDELHEKAREFDSILNGVSFIIIKDDIRVSCWQSGEVYIYNYSSSIKIKNRTYEQMLMIMEALK